MFLVCKSPRFFTSKRSTPWSNRTFITETWSWSDNPFWKSFMSLIITRALNSEPQWKVWHCTDCIRVYILVDLCSLGSEPCFGCQQDCNVQQDLLLPTLALSEEERGLKRWSPFYFILHILFPTFLPYFYASIIPFLLTLLLLIALLRSTVSNSAIFPRPSIHSS